MSNHDRRQSENLREFGAALLGWIVWASRIATGISANSLAAASILTELETIFGVKIPWALLDEAGTIQQLAPAIENLQEQTK